MNTIIKRVDSNLFLQRVLEVFKTKFIHTDFNINCRIDIGKIDIKDRYCKLVFFNNCSGNGAVINQFFLDSLYEVLSLTDEEERNYILQHLKLTMEDIKENKNVGVIQDCNTVADLGDQIKIDSINVNSCIRDGSFYIINTGDSNTNCLFKKLDFGEQTEELKISFSLLGEGLIEFLKYIAYLFILISIITLIISFKPVLYYFMIA